MRVRMGWAAAVAVIGMSVTAGGAWATQEPAGTAIVTPNPAAQSPPLDQLAVSAAGVTYVTQQPGQLGSTFSAYYRPFAGAASVVASPSPNPQSIGDVVSIVDGVEALVQTDPNDATLVNGVTLQPLAGGAPVTLPVDEHFERYLGSTGTGIVVLHFLQSGDFGIDVVLRRAGQPDQVLDHLPNDTSVRGLVDQDGVFLQTDVNGGALYYIDLSTAAVTQVNTDPADASAQVAFMTPTTLGWAGGLDHRTMVWMPRSGGPQTRLAVPVAAATASAFGFDGSSVAFYAPGPGSLWTMYTMPADGSASATTIGLDVTAPDAVAAPGGGFLVAGRQSPTSFGIYQVQAGQASMFQPIAAAWAQPASVAMSSGRLVFTDTAQADPGAALWSLPTTRSGGAITLGGESLLASDASPPATASLLASDDRTAYIDTPATGRQVAVLNGATVERTIPLPSTEEVVALAGDQLLIHAISTSNWWAVNTVTGTQTAVTTTVAALGGRYLYYQGVSKGQLLRLDLTAPASATNPVQVRAADGCGMLQGNLIAWGYWVAYHCGGTPTKNKLEARNTSTKVVVTLQTGQLDQIGDGVMLYQSLGVLYSLNLTATGHPVTAIGDLGSANGSTLPQLYTLDASGEAAAWLAGDDRLHIAPLPITASAPAILDAQPGTTLAAGGTWHDNLDLSKPVTWKLVLKSSAGTTVRTLTGTATDGSIRATWNGQNTKSVAVAAGTYTWKLTATGLDTVGKTTQSGTLIKS